jgi:hypothetical protein
MDHEFFNIGGKFTVERDVEPDTARIVEVADAKGRGHECILEIYIYRTYEDEFSLNFDYEYDDADDDDYEYEDDYGYGDDYEYELYGDDYGDVDEHELIRRRVRDRW